MEEAAANKKTMKRKFSQFPLLGVVPPFNGGSKPMARNAMMARKALNPQAYEANAVKQMQSYKQTKSMELFKERGMKFTCVDPTRQQQQQEGRSGREGTCATLSPIASVSACPVDMMDPSDREAIQFYEGERNGSRETNGVRIKTTNGGGCEDKSLERAKRFGILPRFDPRIPPPSIGQQKQKMVEQLPQQKRQIKQEIEVVVEEISDEIPSFQIINSVSSKERVMVSQTTNSDAQCDEIEEKKKKLQLLWSLCQEELTVEAELDKTDKQLVELRKSLDALTKAIKIKEKAEGMQKQRKKLIGERKKLLLTGVGVGQEELTKVKRETGEQNAED